MVRYFTGMGSKLVYVSKYERALKSRYNFFIVLPKPYCMRGIIREKRKLIVSHKRIDPNKIRELAAIIDREADSSINMGSQILVVFSTIDSCLSKIVRQEFESKSQRSVSLATSVGCCFNAISTNETPRRFICERNYDFNRSSYNWSISTGSI